MNKLFPESKLSLCRSIVMTQFQSYIALVDPNLSIFSLSFSSCYPDGEVVGPMVDPNISRRNFFLYLFTGNILHFFTFSHFSRGQLINFFHRDQQTTPPKATKKHGEIDICLCNQVIWNFDFPSSAKSRIRFSCVKFM